MGTNTSNRTAFDELITNARNLGAAEGTGQDSRIKLAIDAFNAARIGDIDAAANEDKSPDHAHQIYAAFVEGRHGVSDHSHEVEKSRKVQVSKLRTVIKCGAHPSIRDGKTGARSPEAASWADTAKSAVMAHNGKAAKSIQLFEGVVKIAREQVKTLNQPKADQNVLMDNEAMLACLEPAETVEKTTSEKLQAMRDKLSKLNDGTDETPGLNQPAIAAAVADLDKAIAAIAPEEQKAEIDAMDEQAKADKIAALKIKAKADREMLAMLTSKPE